MKNSLLIGIALLSSIMHAQDTKSTSAKSITNNTTISVTEKDFTEIDTYVLGLKTDYLNIEKAIKKNYPNAVVMPVLFPATTDNSYFRNAGINSYGFLPFCLNEEMMESVHSSNEKLPVSAITNGIKLYYYNNFII